MNPSYRPLFWLLAAPLVLASTSGPADGYRFDEVYGKVTLRRGAEPRRVAAGEAALAGDEVATGWFASAVLQVKDRGSRFALQPLTTVVLGGAEDGILLRVERGRLRAMFEKLVGQDQRLVATPGALLAVRGTRYGLDVDRFGNTTLAVFEGSVEVRPRGEGRPSLLIARGEACRVDPDAGAERWRMPVGMTEHSWMQQGRHDSPHAGHGGMDGRDGHGGEGGGGPHGGHDGHGGGGHGGGGQR